MFSVLMDDEYYSYSSNDDYWHKSLTPTLIWLENEIVRLLTWYDNNETLHTSIKNTLKEYRDMENSFGENEENKRYKPKFHYEPNS